MRHVLVDRANARLAQKREGALQRVTLDNEQVPRRDQPEALLDLNDAIERLAARRTATRSRRGVPLLRRVDRRRDRGGAGGHDATVQRDWAKARMLLRRALSA